MPERAPTTTLTWLSAGEETRKWCRPRLHNLWGSYWISSNKMISSTESHRGMEVLVRSGAEPHELARPAIPQSPQTQNVIPIARQGSYSVHSGWSGHPILAVTSGMLIKLKGRVRRGRRRTRGRTRRRKRRRTRRRGGRIRVIGGRPPNIYIYIKP